MRRPGIFKTRGLAISSQVAIIWYRSLGALTDCTRRCDLGSGHFNPTGNGQTRGLLVSEVWPLHGTGENRPFKGTRLISHKTHHASDFWTLRRLSDAGPAETGFK